jgi:hypothetical protein
MKMEYTAEVLRGWPADGARERLEIVKQGVTLVNGDIVQMQTDGTVDKVGATKSKRVGLVVRGNGDSTSAANSYGKYMTPQPTKNVTAMTWSGGVVSVTITSHGYSTGNLVTIAGVTPTGYNGTYNITVVDANTFTFLLASNPGTVTVQGTAQLSGVSNSGKAVVLWGNYIVRTQNFTAGAWAPGSPVTAKNGKFEIAAGQGNADGTYTVTATNTIDPEVGYCIRVQGATTTESAHIVVVAF